ncbi:Acyl-coenzyme A synthetase ACSM3, mitochondrial [Folsomia candida]|uniref:medium-chain acyl-CoA ligase n=1 Tax=Folsomia candida TaxID=158441 RepID=A0A226ECI5_FOLCA|nr:Acyl-coenzyme A synthetase ACSM3, mitochondrial [Folsomia candida]
MRILRLRPTFRFAKLRQFSTTANTGLGDQILTELEEIWKKGKAPEKFNFSRDIFDRHALHRPTATALWFDNGDPSQDRKWSFSEVQKESLRSAIFLRNMLNLREGSPPPYVLTILSRLPEWCSLSPFFPEFGFPRLLHPQKDENQRGEGSSHTKMQVLYLHLSAIRVGTIFCPGTTMLTSEDIEYRLDASRAGMIITDEENMDKVDDAYRGLVDFGLKKVVIRTGDKKPVPLKNDWIDYHSLAETISANEIDSFRHLDTPSDQVAQGYFTSGTTGKPKMVAHTHSSYGIGHYTTVKMLDLKETDLHWNISDPGWAKSSYSNFFAPWTVGSAVYIHQMERFEAPKVLKALSEKPITTFCAPPTLYKSMVQETDPNLFKFPKLRYCIGAGEPVSPEVIRSWQKNTGVVLHQAYGQTEMTAVDCEISSKDDSIGIANGFMNIRIVDDAGKECPIGTEGQLALRVKPVRPVGLFKGYLKKGANGPELDTEKNSSVFVGDVYLTGDRAYKDDSGHVFLVGRADDVITSAGYRIGPSEIEASRILLFTAAGVVSCALQSVLQTHPSVVESAVVASPDPQRGEVVKAFIILTPQYKTIAEKDEAKLVTEIQNFVKKHTAPYKYPRKVEFVDTLPKTVSGKILRRELKRMEYEKGKK